MMIWSEEKLDILLSIPSKKLIEDISKIEGDIMVLGAGGKMGPSLCILAKNAIANANIDKKVIAVSRFNDPFAIKALEDNGIEIIKCDLLDLESVQKLPNCKNIIYMAGKKFGTVGNEWLTWGMNATMPSFVADKFKDSNIVVFSTGNIYPVVSSNSTGSKETDPIGPIGDYPMSCLARERAFEYVSNKYGTKVLIYRLNYAVDLRYGVIFDIAKNIIEEKPISLATPAFNCIWQGSANEMAIRSLLYTTSPATIMNITGKEKVFVKDTASKLGILLKKKPIFLDDEGTTAYLSDASKALSLFGMPSVTMPELIKWQAEWLLAGGRVLDKPTHFQEKKGKY